MIKTGGENVASREVEEAIYAHPGVMEVAIFGIPDSKWIEAVNAQWCARASTVAGANGRTSSRCGGRAFRTDLTGLVAMCSASHAVSRIEPSSTSALTTPLAPAPHRSRSACQRAITCGVRSLSAQPCQKRGNVALTYSPL